MKISTGNQQGNKVNIVEYNFKKKNKKKKTKKKKNQDRLYFISYKFSNKLEFGIESQKVKFIQ